MANSAANDFIIPICTFGLLALSLSSYNIGTSAVDYEHTIEGIETLKKEEKKSWNFHEDWSVNPFTDAKLIAIDARCPDEYEPVYQTWNGTNGGCDCTNVYHE